MQKVLKTAALAEVSCSNAALREGSASQAERVAEVHSYQLPASSKSPVKRMWL
jgi:hypothetical protein